MLEVFSFMVAGVIAGINHPWGPWNGTRIYWCPELSDLTPWSFFESRRPGDTFSLRAQFSQGCYITLCEAGAKEIGWESQTAHHREHPWDWRREKRRCRRRESWRGSETVSHGTEWRRYENALCTCLNVPVWKKKKSMVTSLSGKKKGTKIDS